MSLETSWAETERTHSPKVRLPSENVLCISQTVLVSLLKSENTQPFPTLEMTSDEHLRIRSC